MARPTPLARGAKRHVLFAVVGGLGAVFSLVALAVSVWLRSGPPPVAIAAPPVSAAPLLPDEPPRLDPNGLLGEARRKATQWHRDAVLVGVDVGPLDARGVITEGKVEVTYAKPRGQRVSGGAEASNERLVLTSTGGALVSREERRGRAQIAPEPNCVFDDAWGAALRAGADAQAALAIRYVWSDKYARAMWEVTGSEGQVLRRVDGVNCSIITR